jgi:uncharacterized protein (TIGR00251 family)
VSASPPWARRSGDHWLLEVRVQPGASRTEVAGMLGDRLKVRIAAPAVDGRANSALVAFLADRLGVAKGQVEVVRGASNRSKTVSVPATTDPFVLHPDSSSDRSPTR